MSHKNSPDNRQSPTTVRQRAEELLRTRRTDISEMSREDVRALIHELEVHQIELELQNEELREAQVELAHARDQCSDFYEFAPIGYVTLDRNGKILHANLTAAKMLGVDRQCLLEANIANFVVRESHDECYLHRQAVLGGETKQTCELPMTKADGTTLFVRLESVAFGAENDRHCRIALIDVSQRKEAEEALQRLNKDLGRRVAEQTSKIRLLAEAVSHLGEGVLITNNHLEWPDPHIVFVNAALCRITGYTADELIGQSPRILQGDATDRETWDRITAELSAGRSALAELTNYRKDGTPYDAELFITPLFNLENRRTNFVSIHRDITERKTAEANLRRLSGVFQVAADPILVEDLDGHVLEMNNEAVRAYGWSREELLGQSVKTLVPPERHGQTDELLARCKQHEEVRNVESLCVSKDGNVHPVLITLSLLTDDQNRPVGIASLTKNISHLKCVEKELHEREERLRTVLNTASDAIINIDRGGIITAANPAAEQMFGYTQDELIGRNVNTLMPPPYCDEHDGYIARYLQTGEARILGLGREVVGKRKDGTMIPIDLAVSEVGHLGLFTGVIRDISERQKLQRDILSVADEEQRRIGQELHDSTQQELVGLGLLGKTFVERLVKQSANSGEGADADLVPLAKKIVDGILRVQHQVQEISHGLVPGQLADAGLMESLHQLARRIDEFEVASCAFKCEEPVEIGNRSIETHLYRIAQEALTNALKHAQPQHILISVESDDEGHPVLLIADDGKGFNGAQSNEGMGLKTMLYRASLIGAKLTVSPIPTGGTLVSCKVFGGVTDDV